MAEKLNSYFSSVFTKEGMNNVPEVLRNTSFSEELKKISVTREIILGKLIGLKGDKSPGPDDLLYQILKKVALEIVGHVPKFFGMIPTDWRVAKLSPLFKEGGREETGNYRPVSLVLVVGKFPAHNRPHPLGTVKCPVCSAKVPPGHGYFAPWAVPGAQVGTARVPMPRGHHPPVARPPGGP